MSTSIRFIVPGVPISQPRQRHAMIAGRMHNYTPSKHPVNEYKTAIKIFASQHFTEPLHGPVRLEIVAAFPRPKGHFRTGKRSGEVKPGMPTWHTTKPDEDNVRKAVKDALSGIAYRDDCQVCDGGTIKYYNVIPYTEIIITNLEGTECPAAVSI